MSSCPNFCPKVFQSPPSDAGKRLIVLAVGGEHRTKIRFKSCRPDQFYSEKSATFGSLIFLCPNFVPISIFNHRILSAHPDDAVIMYGYTAESLAGCVVDGFRKTVTLFQNTA